MTNGVVCLFYSRTGGI